MKTDIFLLESFALLSLLTSPFFPSPVRQGLGNMHNFGCVIHSMYRSLLFEILQIPSVFFLHSCVQYNHKIPNRDKRFSIRTCIDWQTFASFFSVLPLQVHL